MQEKVSDTKSSPQGAPKGDLDPHWSWGRHLPAWGAMGVDFESRVEFDRMRRYRLARARQALENSNLGALLLFDVNNIRYVSATKIGEWERDKLARFALLARGKEPIVWDLAPPRCTTSSTRRGSSRSTARRASSACAAPCRRASA